MRFLHRTRPRRLLAIPTVAACLIAGCGGPARYVRVRAAAPPTATDPARSDPTARETAAHPRLTAKQRADRRRWFLTVWLAAWAEQQRVACDGDLPPCYVAQRESKFNPYAVNPGHLGAPYGDPGDPWTHASGKWQFMPGTWSGYGGYPYAAAAPVWVQNDKARAVWAGGAGASNWACC